METYQALGYYVARPATVYGRDSELMSGEPIYDGGYREGSVDAIFGGDSLLGVMSQPDVLEPSLSVGVIYQLLILISLIVYLTMLFRSWGFVGSIWSGVVGTNGESRMADEGGELPLARFKNVASVLGILLLALVGVRLVDGILPYDSVLYADSRVLYAPVVALLLVGAILAWQYALHKIVEWITRTDAVTTLAAILRMNFVRMVVVLYPLIAVWLVVAASEVQAWSITLAICFVVLLIIYLKDTFLFFIGKNISILYWFLYLCTAILLPLSFLYAIVPTAVG